MKREQTVILTPTDERQIIEIKEELLREGRKRRILNTTIITVNMVRNTVSVTSDCQDFIDELSSNKKYKAVPVFFPILN